MSTRIIDLEKRLTRRGLLKGAASACSGLSIATLFRQGQAAPPDPDCIRCRGIGRIPIADAKPFVWLKGTPLPKLESAVGEEYCPNCQGGADSRELVSELKRQIDGAIAANKLWEERTGWKLACVVTRNAAVHTQLTTTQARPIGNAIETLLGSLKRGTNSLELASTRPDEYGLVLLSEKASWDAFRKVMESQYSLAQLGESWVSARDYNAFDHYAVPHWYETSQTMRARPPACGAVFLVGRRQLQLATDWHAPFWLTEGFAAYGDNLVHKLNRWYSVYLPKQIPAGDWFGEGRKLLAESRQIAWNVLMKRPLRDWQATEHVQTMTMAAFLFEAEPGKFLNYLRRLKRREEELPALTDAYQASLEELEERWARWLRARK